MYDIDELKNQIGQRLKELIKEHHLTPNSFAKKLGYQQTTRVYKTINGRSIPTVDFIYDIKEAFPKTDLNWLIYGAKKIKNIIVDEINEPPVGYSSEVDTLKMKLEACQKENALKDELLEVYKNK